MFGAIAGGIASALAGGAMSKLFGGGQKAASGGIQGDVLATDNNTVGMGRSEERFSRNAETDIVCRLLLEKKNRDCYRRQLTHLRLQPKIHAHALPHAQAHDRFGE